MGQHEQAVPVNKANGGVSQPQAGQPSYAELLARIQELEASKNTPLTIRINDGVSKDKDGKEVKGKGTVCVYGLQRFPVGLYAEQWERLLTPEMVKAILAECKNPRAARKVR